MAAVTAELTVATRQMTNSFLMFSPHLRFDCKWTYQVPGLPQQRQQVAVFIGPHANRNRWLQRHAGLLYDRVVEKRLIARQQHPTRLLSGLRSFFRDDLNTLPAELLGRRCHDRPQI